MELSAIRIKALTMQTLLSMSPYLTVVGLPTPYRVAMNQTSMLQSLD